jgi:hypothetical protein
MSRQSHSSQNNMQRPAMENFIMNPNDYELQKQTYEIDASAYYSPPWPAQRTGYDMVLQNQFNTIKLPDYLNFSDAVKKQQGLPDARPSIKTGRYDNYSY